MNIELLTFDKFLLGKCRAPINILNAREGKYPRAASKHLDCELPWILRICITKLSRRTNLLEEKSLWEQFLTLAAAKTESTGKERCVYSFPMLTPFIPQVKDPCNNKIMMIFFLPLLIFNKTRGIRTEKEEH